MIFAMNEARICDKPLRLDTSELPENFSSSGTAHAHGKLPRLVARLRLVMVAEDVRQVLRVDGHEP
jgi:hypothetical protein